MWFCGMHQPSAWQLSGSLHTVSGFCLSSYADVSVQALQGMEAVPYLSERYVVALEYGSLVFLNFSAAEQQQVLDEVQPFCDTQFQEARKDGMPKQLANRPSLSLLLLYV